MNEITLSKQQKLKIWFREQALPIVVLLVLMFSFVRPFVVEAYRIPSGSMSGLTESGS